MHSLVETFVDSQLEAYSAEEEADMSLTLLIGQLWTTKKDQTGTELSSVSELVAARERFSTSDIIRNFLKLSETELMRTTNQ